MLDRIQHGAEMTKAEVWLGVEGYWWAMKTHNKEHRWRQWHNPLQGVKTCHWGFLGFVGVQMLASAHALHLPTKSVQVFQGGSNLWGWVNSESSLAGKRGDEARKGLAIGLAFRWGWRGKGSQVWWLLRFYIEYVSVFAKKDWSWV